MSALEMKTFTFDKASINNIDNREHFVNYPVIYILNGQKEAYIGETVYFKNRMKAHLKQRKNIDAIRLIHHVFLLS